MENDIKHNEEFILKKVGKKPGFSAPTNYFNAVEFDVLAKITEEKFNKTSSFEVPKDYFKNVDEKIFANINLTYKSTKVISLKKRILKVVPYVAAACIALYISLNTFMNADKKVTFEAISDSEIEYWLDEKTINTNEIATLLGDEILNENIFSFADIEDESIEDYMNSIDNSSLLNELN